MDRKLIYSRLQLGFRRRLPLVLQSEAAECGLACIAMITSYHGREATLRELRQKFSMSLKGVTIGHLVEIAGQLNLTSRPLSLEADEVKHLQLPCIVHWNLNHFVVLEAISRNAVEILDPAVGRKSVLISEFRKRFTGVALELTPNPEFKKKRSKDKVNIGELTGKVIGLKRSLGQILLIALAIEICSIVSPFFVQWVTDEAVVTGDTQLVLTLAIGFAIIWSVQTCIETIRAWIVTHMGVSLNVQWLANVGSRLLRLPSDFFTKRHLGDIVARANTVNVIQNTISTSLVEAFLDGLMSIGTLVMMTLYSVKLAMISVIAVVLYVLLRIGLYGSLRSANESQFVFDAKQQTFLLESIRGIQSIKLFGKENSRISGWLNHVVRQKNAYLRTQRLMTVFHGTNSLLFRAENLIVIVMGAGAVIDKSFSIGMLLAYLSYREQFSKRVTSLVDKSYEFRMLDVQLTRLADIMYEKEEIQRVDSSLNHGSSACIELRDISFRYAETDEDVISRCNFMIESGEHVAIVGPSGAGKTTLLKIIAGLQHPSSGTLLINGVPASNLGTAEHRSLIGAVMQDDHLFAGTIAENICFFDETPDHARIVECARLAAIFDEIKQMPMGFNSLVGDMGSVLSGGQKQRVLLARALYKQPAILLLDEATSHLDVSNERLVNEAIQELNLTRVVIAHRPETIRSAGRAINIMEAQEGYTPDNSSNNRRSESGVSHGIHSK